MKVITLEQYDEIKQENTKYLDVLHKTNGFDYIEKRESCFQNLYHRKVELRPGLSLLLLDETCYQDTNISNNHDGFYGLTSKFYLSGNHGVICPGIEGVEENYQETAGNNYLFYLPDIEEIEQDFAGEHYQQVRIYSDLNFFRSFSGEFESLPKQLQLLIEGDSAPLFHRPVGKITPAMQTVLWQIINAPYQGIVQRVYLESKTLELLALQLAQFIEAEEDVKIICNLKAGEIEKIHQAKEILIDNMTEPPTLLDLAQQVGIYHMKLKQGFRELFGITPFGYLHNHRMEMAQNLLLENQLNVMMVASAVGYSNPSHFAAAFKKKFGISPNACKLGNTKR